MLIDYNCSIVIFSETYDSRVCTDCPFDDDDPKNQFYIHYGPHSLTKCFQADPSCPTGQTRVKGNTTTDRR